MKIFSSEQIKKADQFTIQHEPVSGIDLMERASGKLTEYLLEIFNDWQYIFFIGPGNNGGDGLAMARMIHEKGFPVRVYVLDVGKSSEENKTNLERANKSGVEMIYLKNQEEIEKISFTDSAVIVDALYGHGLNRELEGLSLLLVRKINSLSNFVVSIDLPSGLSADGVFKSTSENTVVADYTLTIEFPKLAFCFAENEKFIGEVQIVPIGISQKFIHAEPSEHFFLDPVMIKDMIVPRSAFAHKGTFGHALIIGGSMGKIGAAILSAKAAARTGCGLVSLQVPSSAAMEVHTAFPETMVIGDNDPDKISTPVTDITKYNAIGFGPGTDKHEDTARVLKQLIQNASQPLVIDADGLNILSENKTWLHFLTNNTILTPHPGEFDRLTQKHNSGFERYKTQIEFSKKYGVYVVLKGHNTSITTPSGLTFFNSTGNSGMATGGSGDVLTGIITSLCAQGYSALHAALVGVYLHGYAGDRAAEKLSENSMIASDIIENIPEFWKVFGR